MDDKKLWEGFLSGCKPLELEKELVSPDENESLAKLKSKIKANGLQGRASANLVLFRALNLRPLAIGDLSALNGAQAERMRKGKIVIEARIDLHYCTLVQAEQKLKEFLRNCYQQCVRMVLVVTGKGKGGNGVLRSEIPSLLNQPEVRPLILAATNANGIHGGDGAYYLLLKNFL